MIGIQAKECGVSTGLQIYLQDIKDDALLTAAEERELAAAIARGDKDARRRMIEANLRLVVKIARDYMGRGIALDDLIGEGNLGLIRATQEYDPRFGTRFSTYASYWIKQAIRHALINTTTTIRLPAHMVGLLTRWRRAERSLCKELRRAPSFEEIASFLGLSEMQKTLVARAQRARQLKLENGLADDANHWSPDEAIDERDAPESSLEADDDRALLRSRMDRLDDRERVILSWRYGLEGTSPLTLKEIGRRLGVTREWVRKIELRAVRKLGDQEPEAPRRSARRAPRRAMAAAH
jgi:RNA polymerase primary sigma factor